MTSYTPRLLSNHRLCSYSRLFAQIIEQTILSQITERTTPAQLAAAKFSVRALSDRLAAEAKLDWSHYPAEQGTHSCVRNVYADAIFRLENIILLRPEPAPQPEPPAAPSPQPLSDEDLMAYVERWSAESAQQTFFGSVADGEDQHDTGTPRT
jgi:hypothetical protein